MKGKLLFFVGFLAFFLNMQFNFFHLIEKDVFNDSGREISETLVTGKLLNSTNGNIFEDGGFPGTFILKDSKILNYNRNDYGRESHEKYLGNETVEKGSYVPYQTQIGGQALFYAAFQQLFPFSHATDFQIFGILNSLLLSLCFAGFVNWIHRRFGFPTATLSAFFMLFNFWLFLYGRSIWWCNWVYFLPLVYGLHFFENEKIVNPKKYILVMAILFFIKFWFTGFEFITTFLISSSVPYLLYQFKNCTNFYRNFILQHFIITAIPLLLILSFFLFQFYLVTGNFSQGIVHLKEAFLRRTSDGYSYPETSKQLNFLKNYHLDIIVRYLGNSVITRSFVTIPFAILFSAGLLSGVFLYTKKIERRFIWITLFSFLAPLSWLVLFKEHAHIHTHIDFFVWYLPTGLFLIILVTLALQNIFVRSNKNATI